MYYSDLDRASAPLDDGPQAGDCRRYPRPVPTPEEFAAMERFHGRRDPALTSEDELAREPDRRSMLIDFISDYDHGILVIEQLEGTADLQGWDVYAQGAHAEDDSIYIGVLPLMEGRVSTSVRTARESQSDQSSLFQVFQGRRVVRVGCFSSATQIEV